MTRRTPLFRPSTVLPSLLALALAAGWAWREVAHAQEARPITTSKTVNVDDVAMSVYKDEGKPVGRAGLYFEGPTELCSSLVAGRFVIDPGKSPHPPHVHPDEEILIVESGRGEIFCDGKTMKVGPGSVMFSAPNVPHNISSSGPEPVVFYFMKWLPKTAK
ncbi:cupin domain-containing protein [Paludisphaera mucosa]|uniref:Cupin domain-containing protein n=1 Tax=Paludisphaera mucosa TaxID=3030827 RepID=A0ABT6F8W2_9BACT|nr:cupin domain-containing protein [Paludisphaera mucosa]MDG3004027.1 cupin domain-containing protein [Paludisphaera mucosa]